MDRSIRIETLGDLVAHDSVLCATCERCRRRNLDMAALIEKLGGSFIYVGGGLDHRLVRMACGAKDVSTQVHPLYANSRLAATGWRVAL